MKNDRDILFRHFNHSFPVDINILNTISTRPYIITSGVVINIQVNGISSDYLNKPTREDKARSEKML